VVKSADAEAETRVPDQVRRGDVQRGLDVATAGDVRAWWAGVRRFYWCIPRLMRVTATPRDASRGR